MTDEQFSTYLKNYLFTQKGAKFRSNFKFEKSLECRSSIAPPISVSFRYVCWFLRIIILKMLFQSFFTDYEF
jgi:hypothetical protein